ncbi:basic membrane protein A [Thermocatellispora tengchongensis]|uniref:Basic membrane protein A n=1 Tax=Thermocatellispora tengchongensis TaxID=1073253 RepID=A0A840PPM5_9ACTN|nr:BMP family ABC transporter substrate-binding protein [Thermocatellispora tengchongensis]MBB5139027.1 basic membrane protein A [Thermocatellispora tengchongensis]
MKRLLVLLLGLILLTACSTATTGAQPAPAGDPGGGQDCGYAFVHASTIGSSLFEKWAEDGVQKAKSELGVAIDSVESATPTAIADNLRAFAQRGCKKMIATISFSASEALTQVAKEFPNQQFAILDAEVNLPNVRSYAWAVEQATYVAGVAAARLSKSKTIGAVFGMEVPPLKRWQAGYELGAKAADPATKVLVNYVGSFSDPAKALTLAIAQKQQGADVILPASGSNLGVISESVKNGFSVAAVDPEEAQKGGRAGVAFTMWMKVADSVRLLFGEDWTGAPKGGTRNLTLKDGVFEFDPLTTSSGAYDAKVPADVVKEAKAAYDGIVAGTIVVKNPLTGQ